MTTRLSDRVGFITNVDSPAQDIRTVLDAAGSRRVVLLGALEGACIRFAANHPDRAVRIEAGRHLAPLQAAELDGAGRDGSQLQWALLPGQPQM